MIQILIRYLGIKTKLLEPIKMAIDAVTPGGGTVLDLFAGSNTVGQYLLPDYNVITNDYQHYSYIAAKALIEPHSADVIGSLSCDVVYNDYYKENFRELSNIFAAPLRREQELLHQIGEQYYGSLFDEFVSFYNHSPYYGNTEQKDPSFNDCLSMYSKDTIAKYQADHSLYPFALFTTYYGNPYFSLHQCIEIDSLMYSLHRLYTEGTLTEELYNIYLSFILYSLNLIVISVGDHFAQPQKIKEVSENFSNPRDKINLRERKKILSKKRIAVASLFTEKLEDYKANYICGKPGNRAFCSDYKTLLESADLKPFHVDTVYIDPPYTNAHYSRFYHIPETLVLYDYPEIEFFGRYRTDRLQSGFCIKRLAAEEFRTMLNYCHEAGYNAVISYSDTSQCILSIDEVKALCNETYCSQIKVDNVSHMYRNFGQKPNRVLAKEYIITCYGTNGTKGELS